MRKKGKKVIRPAGDELMDYLNRGFAICTPGFGRSLTAGPGRVRTASTPP